MQERMSDVVEMCYWHSAQGSSNLQP